MTLPIIKQALAQRASDLGFSPGNHGENKVAIALARLGIRPPTVEQQFQLGKYRLDFAFVRERVCIEADGWVHTSSFNRKRDRERDGQLKFWGWQTYRIDIENLDEDELIDALLEVIP